MSEKKIHNLDQEYAEYFEFILQGHTYRCRYPSGEEIETIQKSIKDESSSVDVFKSLISSVDNAPDLEEVWKKMRTPQIKAFVAMLKEEFSMF